MTRRLMVALVATLLIAQVAAEPTLATPVTQLKYNKWRQDQAVPFMWKADLMPPAWMRPGLLDAATDAGATTYARAARFDLASSAASWFGYTTNVCTDTALACAWNNAPTSFTVRLRPQGWTFDWGTLRWCQFYVTWPDGCFDVEMITLHELGHIQGLGHNDDTGPDEYLDTVMHGVSRAKNKQGWNAHAFGRCDVASLQAGYQPADSGTLISTCLSLATYLDLSASATFVPYRGGVRFTATLATTSDVAYPKLRSLPLTDRTVTLELRPPGGTWYSVGQMAPTATEGEYALIQTVTTTYDWRVTFAKPAGEGLAASSSGAVRVTVGACTSGCPMSIGGGT